MSDHLCNLYAFNTFSILFYLIIYLLKYFHCSLQLFAKELHYIFSFFITLKKLVNKFQYVWEATCVSATPCFTEGYTPPHLLLN
jgi:hypothetical protein